LINRYRFDLHRDAPALQTAWAIGTGCRSVRQTFGGDSVDGDFGRDALPAVGSCEIGHCFGCPRRRYPHDGGHLSSASAVSPANRSGCASGSGPEIPVSAKLRLGMRTASTRSTYQWRREGGAGLADDPRPQFRVQVGYAASLWKPSGEVRARPGLPVIAKRRHLSLAISAMLRRHGLPPLYAGTGALANPPPRPTRLPRNLGSERKTE